MKKIILIILIIGMFLINSCENSTQTCFRYCVNGEDTTGWDIKDAWNKLKQAENKCKKQCSNPP